MSNYAHIRDLTLFGFWVYLMSDCVLFAALFATFFVLRESTFGSVTIGDITNLLFVCAETIILLTSSFTIGLAVLASHAKKLRLTATLLSITLALGLTFLGMEGAEFTHLLGEGSGPSASAFLSSFFTLVGTHGLHVFVGALWMLSLIHYLVRKGVTESSTRKLLLLSLFWHFLDVIWIFIFTFVYLFGAL